MSMFPGLLGLLVSGAEAAGPATIMRQLAKAGKKISLDEAQALKNAAKARQATDLPEENIRAIQAVRDAYKGDLPYFGSGLESKVYDAGSSVVKIPQTKKDPLPNIASPVLLEELGVPTKNVLTSRNVYQVQDKVNTPKVKAGSDADFQKLQKEQDDLFEKAQSFARENNLPVRDEDDVFNYMSPAQKREYQNLTEAMNQRKIQLWQEKGLDPNKLAEEINALPQVRRDQLLLEQRIKPDEITEYPMDALAALAKVKANRKAKAFTPEDVHAGNVGLDEAGNPKIFDTGFFTIDDVSAITPEQRKAIMDSVVADKSSKRYLTEKLTPSDVSKAAAFAAVPSQDASLSDTALEVLGSILNSPTAEGLMDLLSIPGSVSRQAIDSVTQGSLPTAEQLQRAATFPNEGQSELSERITERVVPNSDEVIKRTVLKTLLEAM